MAAASELKDAVNSYKTYAHTFRYPPSSRHLALVSVRYWKASQKQATDMPLIY